jgi:hypothetical protein
MGNYTSSIIGKDPSKKYKLKEKKEMEGGAHQLTKQEITAIIKETKRLNKLFDDITQFKNKKTRTNAIRKIVQKNKEQIIKYILTIKDNINAIFTYPSDYKILKKFLNKIIQNESIISLSVETKKSNR